MSSSTQKVLKLSAELPLLEHLTLSGNILSYDVDVDAPRVVFPTVHTLVMNQTHTSSWVDLLRICRDHFPALRQLHAASNAITNQAMQLDAASPLSCSSAVEVLDLSHNELSDWSSLTASIGSWPRLHTLSLNGNRLVQVDPPSASSRSLAALSSLSLSDNAVDALNAFPSLEALRLTKNPLLTNVGAAEARMERQDAEQMYLRRILHEQSSLPAGSDKVIQLTHPRLAQLQALYPDIHAAHEAATTGLGTTGSGGGPAALAKSLAKVTFVVMSMNATTMDSMVKSLPLSMTVAQVKAVVEKKYGLRPAEHQLSFRASKKAMPIALDDDGGELGYFGVQDGGELLINDIW
ncbi:hypothetical protein DYB36_003770 [Aphanomyces astaci]|uniref:Ubiquitin-like domain-containing protein n=1 Tax=Aphanomyces astaci TaxID=112090 RepID=A0A396ZUJ1_APHAT|nr:hypothetical protein DYB36_003770 [Aphanomyces astaci]